jgi:hypothetical protein
MAANVAGDWAVRQDTWHHDRATNGVRWVDVAHTWANDRPTRGRFSLEGKGATWPSQGLPRGTPLLVHGYLCKIVVWSRRGSNPRPPGR